MKTIHLLSVIVLLSFCAYADSRLDNLEVLQDNYPRAFFFRGCERYPSRKNADWDKWDAQYSRLMGIMGKCLDEEVLGREAKNPQWFSRFKAAHPDQCVLLHFNGNARDPRHGTEKYFPGHWIYRKAVNIVDDVPAQEGESVIRVDNAADFRVNAGRYKTSNDDIALFRVTPQGKHNWNYCEQVQLLAVDRQMNTITVRRGCYGTEPLAFKAGRTRAAAHAAVGPWGKKNNIMWLYNFSTHCPLDADGQNCADRLVDDLAEWFSEGGKLEAFDGLEFDVLHNVTHGDTTGDGVEDHGVVDEINNYGIGVYNFTQQLRERLGRDIIIQADGALGPGGVLSQRANGILNGIESEGWPNVRDWEFNDWSGGINRHNFWHANACQPAFSYINHKWVETDLDKPGVEKHPEVPFSRHRLALAGAQFTDAVVTFDFAPPRAKGKGTGIWDELNCGADNRIGWLGKPLGETLYLAKFSQNLLKSVDISERISGEVKVMLTDEGVLVSPLNSDQDHLSFRLEDIPVNGNELSVFAGMRAEPRMKYPEKMPRLATVTVAGGCINLLLEDGIDNINRGECLRGEQERELDGTSGAGARLSRAEKIGEETMMAYAVHPPYKTGKGYVYWTREIALPARNYDLRFALGMSEKAPSLSDGVWFEVFVAELKRGKPGDFKKVFEQSTKTHEWIPCSVPLSKWAGKKILIKFVADCGPRDHATTDQGFWGDVKLVLANLRDSEITPAKSYMTWLNQEKFEASFYYRDIRSEKVDLIFNIEGGAPVLLENINAYAAPDVRCRLFENGAVLGNPSHKPFTFDLDKIAQGMKLHRIKATELQDAEVNNGAPVGANVTLDPLDGLFLVRK